MTVNLEKRFSHGLLFQTAWTWWKFMEATSFLNDSGLRPAYTIFDLGAAHRFTLTGIYELPFGRGEPLAGRANRLLGLLISGWQVQASDEGQSGQALGFGNAIFNGEPARIPIPAGQRTVGRWFNTEAGFERRSAAQPGANYRQFPLRFSGIRSDGINNCDASFMKRFRNTGRVNAQFRREAINAANHVRLANPNTTPASTAFGTVTAGKGHGQRQINLVCKVIW